MLFRAKYPIISKSIFAEEEQDSLESLIIKLNYRFTYIHTYIHTYILMYVYIHTLSKETKNSLVIVLFRCSDFWEKHFCKAKLGEVFDPHGIEHSKQMIALMLHHPGMEPVHRTVYGSAVFVRPTVLDATPSRDNSSI